MSQNDKELSQAQEQFILKNYKKYKDLKALTHATWDDHSLDGRSGEGRAVKAFMLKNNLDYKTTKFQKAPEMKLTDAQKKFIEINSLKNPPEKPLTIARILFDDENLTPLSLEFKTIKKFIDENLSGKMIKKFDGSSGEEEVYTPPESLYRAIDLINKATGKKYAYTKLTGDETESLEAVVQYINSHEFIKTVQVYEEQKDRDFLEACLICDTSDKPDLTSSDLSRYIQIARDKLKINKLEKQLAMLYRERNNELEDFDDTKRASQALTEAIDKAERQYENAAARIASAVKVLEGQRVDRKKAEGEANKNILSLVKAMQNEEERQKLLHIKKIERVMVEKEINKISDVGEEIAKIMGISREEALA